MLAELYVLFPTSRLAWIICLVQIKLVGSCHSFPFVSWMWPQSLNSSILGKTHLPSATGKLIVVMDAQSVGITEAT